MASAAIGCSMLDAAWRYARDPATGQRFLDLFWRGQIVGNSSERLTLIESELLVGLQDEVEADLLSMLRTGTLIARWFPTGRTSPEAIHPAWWDNARIDLRLSQAQVGETIITGIKIAELSPLIESPSVISPRPSSLPPLSPKKRGRSPKHDWPHLMAELAVKLSEEGCPGPGEQAALEEWAASRMATIPVESEVRRYVVQAISAHRKSIG